MKKLITIFLLSFIASYSFAQLDTLYPSPPQNLGAKNVLVRDTGGLVVRQMFLAPIYPDTTTANTANPYTRSYVGSVIYTQDIQAYWFRQDIPRKWVLMGSSGGNNNADTIYTEIPIAVKIDSLGRHIIYFLRPNGLYAGGIVTVDSCMTLDITPPTIVVNYKQYTGLQTIGVVVQAADPSLPRIDRVVMDTNLNIIVIEGMPSATPVPPEYNSFSQVSLAEIPVGADITCLGNAEIIFDGIADFAGQWTITTAGTGVTSFINTANPYHLTEASYTVTYSNGYQIIYTKPSGTDTVKATSVFKGFITVVGNFTNQIIGQWYNGSTPVSNQLLLNSYFNVNDSNNYQIFSPQLSAWSWPGGTVYNKLILTFGGNDNSGSNGVYLDWLQIQTGIGNAGNKQYQDSSSIVNGFLTDWYNGIPITRQAVGGGGSETWQQTLINGSQLSQDNNVDLNGTAFRMDYDVQDWFLINSLDGRSEVRLAAWDTANNGYAQFVGQSNSDDGHKVVMSASNSINLVTISGNAATDAFTYTAATNIFNGTIVYNSPPSGAATDSVRTWDAATGTERMRDAASFGSTVLANNGLTKVVDSIQLGGTLTQNTIINGMTFGLEIDGSGSSTPALTVINNSYVAVYGSSTNAQGVYGISTSQNGVEGVSTSQNGVHGTSTNSSALYGLSTNSYGVQAQSTNAPAASFGRLGTSNSVLTDIEVIISNPGSGVANGIGGSIDFETATTPGFANPLSNQIISKWTDATQSTRTSEFSITGVNSAATGTIFTLQGDGSAKLFGSFTLPYVAKTSGYTLTSTDYLDNVTSGTNTQTLPTAVAISGRIYVIKNSGVGVVTLATTGGQTIDGSATQTIATLNSLTVMSDGANWIIL